MGYLYFRDYNKAIQNLNWRQVLGDDLSIMRDWEETAEETAVSYLTQKYNTELEFTDTAVWDVGETYYAGNRVYLDAAAYDPNVSYTVDELTLYNGEVYICGVDTTGQFDPANWTVIGDQYDLFFATYPYPPFDLYKPYVKGTYVFYEDMSYIAQQNSSRPAINNIQYANTRNIPFTNTVPGTPAGLSQWGEGTPYTVAPATRPDNTGFWTKGDNRSRKIVQSCADLVIYYAHARISPQNIPRLRADNEAKAMQWFIDIGQGAATPKLIRRQPNQGNRIRWGGNIQNQNSY